MSFQIKQKNNALSAALLPTYGVDGAKIGWRKISEEKGRGVFARVDITKGETVEVCAVVPVGTANIPDDGGAPDGYLLDWDDEEKGEEHCLALGYIMLYNHSKNSNVELENDYEEMTITSVATRDINAGEEILWDYSCDIWFDEG
jgi:hypothetical protein